jgi:YHS domain-containing protein
MLSNSSKVKDPVRQMLVTPEQNAINYQGMQFAFCSQQCKERFLANPHLYIGLPGEPASKQSGQKVVKRRRLCLDEPLSDADAQRLLEQLHAMMGVYAVEIAADQLIITYDLLQATAEQIETVLQQAGACLGAGRSERLRRVFVHYLEESEVQSLEVRPGPHTHGGGYHHHD